MKPIALILSALEKFEAEGIQIILEGAVDFERPVAF